jgi:hypothetical protein
MNYSLPFKKIFSAYQNAAYQAGAVKLPRIIWDKPSPASTRKRMSGIFIYPPVEEVTFLFILLNVEEIVFEKKVPFTPLIRKRLFVSAKSISDLTSDA